MTDQSVARATQIVESGRWVADGVLDLRGLGLRTVPAGVFEARDVRVLDLSGNRLRELPPDLGELTQLTCLDLAANRLTTLPPAIGRLTRLRRLDVSENRLTTLPPQLAGCTRLGTLSLYDNSLSDVGVLAALPGIVRLDLSTNRLTTLPALRCADTLYQLDLSNNALTEVPAGLATLRRLRMLDLSGNRLTSAAGLRPLGLHEIFLDDNALTEPPYGLVGQPGVRRFSARANPFGPMPAQEATAAAEALAAATTSAIEEHTTGGYRHDRQYLQAATYAFAFSLAFSGIGAVRTVLDLYFKRFRAVGVVVTLADGTRLVLRHLSRKRALELVERHARGSGRTLVDLEPNVQTAGGADFVVATVGRLLDAELVPHRAGAPEIHLHLGGTTMGDQINVGNVTNSNLNVHASLRNVRQIINSSGVADDTRQELSRLADRLAEALDGLPADQRADGEAVAAAAGDLIANATQDAPNRRLVATYADGLRSLAQGLATVAPIATEIIKLVTTLST
ncbi:hypothetical protein GCM10023322_33560 [Rugosimonospora acidiphila]|uniref:Leucine-rich repeat domain-containing protein n=1 Tax=Rugosimonospora acidiphila TaxID=556531 RepID=A0ABP9RT75_9ACTN